MGIFQYTPDHWSRKPSSKWWDPLSLWLLSSTHWSTGILSKLSRNLLLFAYLIWFIWCHQYSGSMRCSVECTDSINTFRFNYDIGWGCKLSPRRKTKHILQPIPYEYNYILFYLFLGIKKRHSLYFMGTIYLRPCESALAKKIYLAENISGYNGDSHHFEFTIVCSFTRMFSDFVDDNLMIRIYLKNFQ